MPQVYWHRPTRCGHVGGVPNVGKDHPLAKRLRAARAYAESSRQQVGAAIGVSDQTIGRWERGDWKTSAPNTALLEAFARATEVPEWFVIGGFEAAGSATRSDALGGLADDALGSLAPTNGTPHPESSPAVQRSPDRRSS